MGDIEFTSYAALGLFVEQMSRRAEQAVGDALEEGAAEVLYVIRDKFGKYQKAEGPFPAWAPLADSTLQRRAARGINPADEPLDESGELKDSYEIVRSGIGQVAIGSESDYAEVQETGDSRIPPRPVVGPAILQVARGHTVDHVRDIFVDVLLNGRRFRDLRKSRAAMDATITPSYGRGNTFEVDSDE